MPPQQVDIVTANAALSWSFQMLLSILDAVAVLYWPPQECSPHRASSRVDQAHCKILVQPQKGARSMRTNARHGTGWQLAGLLHHRVPPRRYWD